MAQFAAEPTPWRVGLEYAPSHIWMVRDMQPLRSPITASVGYQLPYLPLQLILSGQFRSQYQLLPFLFEPVQANLMARYEYSLLVDQKGKLSAFVQGGPNFWQANLTVKPQSGILDYEHKVETDHGWGATSGLGLSAQYGSLSIELGWQIFINEDAAFIAGGFEPKSMQMHQHLARIALFYHFRASSQGISCPTF